MTRRATNRAWCTAGTPTTTGSSGWPDAVRPAAPARHLRWLKPRTSTNRGNSVLDKLLRLGEGRMVKRLKGVADYVNTLSDDVEKLSDAELRAKTDEFRKRVADGADLDDLLPEAFAVAREAAWRVLDQRHFDVQVMGGAALHFGNVAEMKTGEGKTLTCVLPAYLNALGGEGVHVVTVNDYLAKRDAEWMRPVYEALGLTVDALQAEERDPDRKR